MRFWCAGPNAFPGGDMEEKVPTGSKPAQAPKHDPEVQEGQRNVWIFTVYAISFLVVIGLIAFLTLVK